MKQMKSFLLLVVFMFCMTPCLTVNAEGDAVVVAEVTSSSATFDITNFVVELVGYGWTPVSYDVLLSNYYSSATVITGNTTTGFVLYNLQSGTDYYVDVIMTYLDEDGVSNTSSRSAFFKTLGVTEDHENISGGTPSTPQPSPTPQPTPTQVVNNSVPSIKKVSMTGKTVKATIDMKGTDGVEYKICRKKGDKKVADGDTISGKVYEYNIKANNVYYIVARSYVYDDNYNKVYSN